MKLHVRYAMRHLFLGCLLLMGSLTARAAELERFSLEEWQSPRDGKAIPGFQRQFSDIIKSRLRLIGLEDWDDFSPHSLRSGFASVASERTAMRYIRRREGWESSAASKLGL